MSLLTNENPVCVCICRYTIGTHYWDYTAKNVDLIMNNNLNCI